jgi:hypothetical protein
MTNGRQPASAVRGEALQEAGGQSGWGQRGPAPVFVGPGFNPAENRCAYVPLPLALVLSRNARLAVLTQNGKMPGGCQILIDPTND